MSDDEAVWQLFKEEIAQKNWTEQDFEINYNW